MRATRGTRAALSGRLLGHGLPGVDGQGGRGENREAHAVRPLPALAVHQDRDALVHDFSVRVPAHVPRHDDNLRASVDLEFGGGRIIRPSAAALPHPAARKMLQRRELGRPDHLWSKSGSA